MVDTKMLALMRTSCQSAPMASSVIGVYIYFTITCGILSFHFRKNPLHFKEYSHSDREEDEEEDSEKPECEYGTSCYRKNPAHLKEYKHTQPPGIVTGSINKSSC